MCALLASVTLAVLSFSLVNLPGTCAGHGCQFLVVLPSSSYSGVSALVLVVPYDSSLNTTVTWSRYSDTQELDPPYTDTIQPDTLMLREYRLNSETSLFYLQAEETVGVVLRVSGGQGTSLGTFLSLPINQLSTIYTVTTECQKDNCFLTIASHAQSSQVTVLFQLSPRVALVTYHSAEYGHNDVLDLTVQSWQVVHIYSGTTDMTGSVVQSSSSVGVISGGGEIYQADTSGTLRDMIIEQILPEEMSGMEYVLVAFPGAYTTTAKVTFIDGPAVLDYPKAALVLVSDDELYQYYGFKSKDAVVVTSDRPVVVELICQGTDGPAAGVIQIPVDWWTTKYVNIVLSGYIVLAAQTYCTQTVLVDGEQAPDGWTEISKTEYSTSVVQSTGTWVRTVVIESESCNFAGYIFEEQGGAITAWSLGWRNNIMCAPPSLSSYLPSTVLSSPLLDMLSTATYLATSQTVVTEFTSSGLMTSEVITPAVTSIDMASFEISSVFQDLSQLNSVSSANLADIAATTPISMAPSATLWSSDVPTSTLESAVWTPSVDNIHGSVSSVSTVPTLSQPVLTPPLSVSHQHVSSSTQALEFPVLSEVTSKGTMLSTAPTDTEQPASVSEPPPGDSSELGTADRVSGEENGTRLCPCSCHTKKYVTNFSQIYKEIQTIETELVLDKKQLSSYKREKISLENVKESSKSLGSAFGIFVFVIFVCVITLTDMIAPKAKTPIVERKRLYN